MLSCIITSVLPEIRSESPESSDLSKTEVEICVGIITDGGAVNPKSAQAELPLAAAIVLARMGTTIEGVGSIKRARALNVSCIAKNSDFAFDADTSEIGYIAVDEKHRKGRLSHRILQKLVAQHGRSLLQQPTMRT